MRNYVFSVYANVKTTYTLTFSADYTDLTTIDETQALQDKIPTLQQGVVSQTYSIDAMG